MNGTAFAIAPRDAHARGPRARRASEPWNGEVKRILAVRLDHLGDVLMTTPALHALRSGTGARHMTRHITLLASPTGAAIARHLPDVDDVIEYDAPWTSDARSTAGAEPADAALLARLRAGRFDAAAIFTVYSQNPLPAATLCFLAGIERRLAHCRENPYALLTHWLPEREPLADVRHEVERQLALVRSVGAEIDDDDARMRVRVDPTARATLAEKLRQRGVDPASHPVVVHPGASAASRRYPAALYAEALELLAPFVSDPVLLSGSARECALTRSVASFVRAPADTRLVDLAGTLALGEFIALLDSASLLIANNSGPVHLAAALGTPVVDLYALTNPQHTPWMTPHRVLYRDVPCVPCRWCYRADCPEGDHACLRGVPPGDVAQAARELLGPAGAAPPASSSPPAPR